MSKQVAGKPEGATLLDAINDGDVEFPSRMSFMDWLKWRKTTGTRPLKKRDGVSTSLEEENKLWKEVMDFLHDADEEELEEEEEDEEEEEEEVDAAVDPPPPGAHPAAGAHTGLTDEELAALEATSVELLPDEEREAALAAAAAKSAAAPKSSSGPGPARAGPSGPPSTVGSVPETRQAELGGGTAQCLAGALSRKFSTENDTSRQCRRCLPQALEGIPSTSERTRSTDPATSKRLSSRSKTALGYASLPTTGNAPAPSCSGRPSVGWRARGLPCGLPRAHRLGPPTRRTAEVSAWAAGCAGFTTRSPCCSKVLAGRNWSPDL